MMTSNSLFYTLLVINRNGLIGGQYVENWAVSQTR